MSDTLITRLKNTGLPIVEQIDNIRNRVACEPNLVLQAEPGAGKTTIVPLALLATLAANKKILILEPRRLAARNAASRMASLLGETVGQTVGFRIRNETKVSPVTKIEVITEGILTRMLQTDPELAEVEIIIFDEFHERSLDADLGLAFSLEVQQNLREDLKLIIMSATLDVKNISRLLNNAPVIQVEGRTYPVSLEHISLKQNQDWTFGLNSALTKALENSSKDILVFLAGSGEINKAQLIIEQQYKNHPAIVVVPLYGDLPFKQQRQALVPLENKRKIILATNIAETSVTIEGVDCVIDSGYMRQSEFDPNVGFDRLISKRVSLASAVQRMGRAGRLGAGQCYRLWPESESLRAESQPEILRADLAGFSLELLKWGISNPEELALLDLPNAGSFKQSLDLLKGLKAVDSKQKITAHGKNCLSLGIHPRIAHMLIASVDMESIDLACLIAAMLQEKDIFEGSARFNPDFLLRIESLLASKDNDNKTGRIQSNIIQQASQLKIKLNRLLLNQKRSNNKIDYNTALQMLHQAAILLAMVFPDRIAQKRGKGYRLANAGGVQVPDDFTLDSEFLVVIRQGGHGRATKIYQAIEISKQDIVDQFSHLISESEAVYWEDKSQSVKGELNTKLGQLILASRPLANISSEMISQGLIQGITKQGLQKLPWTAELKQWQARVNLLHQLDDYSEIFPDISQQQLTDTLSEWLAPFLNNINRLSQISENILSQALKNILDWNSQQLLEELMPVSLSVASGSKIKLDYLSGDKPVLAVKLQEMFGEKNTPTVAGGLVPVVTHLLSPARRPLQITEDLASFWANSYQEVKKEMKGRYPKHPWPDDPLSAQATKYTKRSR